MNYRSQPNCENTLILTSIFKTGLMKYFTFVTSILTLFFVCQETFAQVQPDNTSKSLDVNQVNKRLSEVKESIEELKANKKDFWDVFDILASLLIPASITFFGFYYSNALKKTEIEREEKRATSEQEIARINARVKQAELLSMFMEALVSPEPRKRTLAVRAILLALPEEGKALVAVLSESDPEPEVRNIAQESLKILLENKVGNQYELEHLYLLYEGEKQSRQLVFKKRKPFLAELRHLRTLGLIKNQPDKTIGGMPQSGKDLRDYVKLTQDGIDYIRE